MPARDRVLVHRLLQQADGVGDRFLGLAVGLLLAQQVQLVGREICRPSPTGGPALGLGDGTPAADAAGRLLGDLGLHGEHVHGGPVPALRPDMGARGRVDQLGRDPHLVALPLDRALQHVAHVQRLADLAHVGGLALVDRRRVLGDDVELAEPGQVGDDVLGDAVRQPPGRLVAAEIGERQHGDGRLGRERRLAAARATRHRRL